MNTPDSEETIKAYLARIQALKAEREETLTPDELAAIALDLGLTEDDLAAGHAAAAKYRERGAGFMRHARWDDAIAELSAASALAPEDVPTLLALAEAHAARWRESRRPSDRQEAQTLARRCLDWQPGCEPAFKLLNSLDVAEPAHRAWRRKPLVWVVLIGLALALVALVTMPYRRSNQQLVPSPPPPTPAPEAVRSAPPGEAQVPVTLVGGPNAEGIRFEPRLSRLNTYERSSYYTFAGALVNTGKTEWQRLTIRLEYLDAAGKPLGADAVKALDDFQAAIRPGDRHLFRHLRKLSPDLAKVQLRVVTRSEVPTRPLQVVAKSVPLAWDAPQSAGVAISARERRATASHNTLFKTTYFKPIFEVLNTGGTPIHTLKLELRTFDAKGRQLGLNQHYAVTGEGMALPPGEMRLDSWIESLPSAPARYELRVVEVD